MHNNRPKQVWRRQGAGSPVVVTKQERFGPPRLGRLGAPAWWQSPGQAKREGPRAFNDLRKRPLVGVTRSLAPRRGAVASVVVGRWRRHHPPTARTHVPTGAATSVHASCLHKKHQNRFDVAIRGCENPSTSPDAGHMFNPPKLILPAICKLCTHTTSTKQRRQT